MHIFVYLMVVTLVFQHLTLQVELVFNARTLGKFD